MTKKKNKNGGGCLRAIFWLVFGTFLGLGAAASIAVYVNKLYIPFTESPTRDPNISAQDSRKKSEQETFEFHETLKRRQAAPFKEENEEQPSRRFVYHLQLGSFSQSELAEELRGKLALEGYTANINTDKTASGDILYRVWLGPFNNRDDADNMRANLALAGYNNVPLLKKLE